MNKAMPKKKPDSVRVQIKADILAQLREYSSDTGIPLSTIVNNAAAIYLAKHVNYEMAAMMRENRTAINQLLAKAKRSATKEKRRGKKV
jgi:hypothetical protein